MLTKEISKSVLFADIDALFVMIQEGNKDIIELLYEKIYVTPELYNILIRTLSIDDLKIMKSFITKVNEYDISSSEVDSIINEFENLTSDEAYAIAYSSKNKIDVILDDPQKAEICDKCGANAVRPSNILAILSAMEVHKLE